MQPADLDEVPPAVVAAFERGGRNFVQIRDADVADQSSGLWERHA